MEIQKLPLEKLNPAKYNPRKDLKPGDPEYEKLKKSMETFGYVEPIVWNKRTGQIVGGHQRLKILQHQGATEIECVVVDLNETQEKALNITLNKVSGDWDLPKLADLISELDNGIFDITLTGFDAAEIEDLFSKVHSKEVEEDKFDLSAALEKATFVERDDIWTVGRHRLMCGDATNAEDVAKLTDGRKVNLVVTDLPYGVSYVGGTGLTIKNDNLKGEEFYNFILASFKNMAENM
ncbi:MAG: DNA modification methylase, partial [Firmicutes bacterium]|nr:DNA modification methylase [Bacillota bacterium]